jgi:putative RNA 2'-phosphotransferase
MSNSHKTIGKFLSLVLRHQPDAAGLESDAEGYVTCQALIAGCQARGFALDQKMLAEIVESNDKQRYSFNADATKIRANQGHSLKNVDLGLQAVAPPALLFHGTTRPRADIILALSSPTAGLRPQSRQHVHLSADVETAQKVGSRHGKPYILTVRAAEAAAADHIFYCSENNVWLADFVPAAFIDRPDAPKV